MAHQGAQQNSNARRRRSRSAPRAKPKPQPLEASRRRPQSPFENLQDSEEDLTYYRPAYTPKPSVPPGRQPQIVQQSVPRWAARGHAQPQGPNPFVPRTAVPRYGGQRIPLIPDGLPAMYVRPGPTSMMPKHIEYILKLIVTNGGLMSIADLSQGFETYLRDNGHVTVRPNLRSSIVDHPDLFSIETDSSRQDVVAVRVELKLCPNHATRGGCRYAHGECHGLHICKWFMEGQRCKFGDSGCTYGHRIDMAHNAQLLQELNLGTLNIQHLRILYKKSRSLSAKFPPVCKFYNTKGCKHDSNDGMTCPGLHVCLHYVKGDCSFGHDRCKRSHNILSPQAKALLVKHGIDIQRSPKMVLEDVRAALQDSDVPSSAKGLARQYQQGAGSHGSLGNLKSSMPSLRNLSLPVDNPSGNSARSRTTSTSSQVSNKSVDTDEAEPSICMYFLRGNCLFKQKCRNLHTDLPYQWQYLDDNTQQWEDFDGRCNKDIELNYCDPENEACLSQLDEQRSETTFKVHFERMTVEWFTQSKSDVRRISTISNVKAIPSQTFATTWNWFWLADDNKSWEKYGEGYIESTLDVTELEESYLVNPEGIYCFATMSNEYQLKLKIMAQRNVETGRERPIRRRPQFRQKISASEDVPASPGPSIPSSAPPHWDCTGLDNNSFQCIEIGKSGATAAEYKRVHERFYETLLPQSFQIRKISRIQNLELWQGYTWKKTWMTQRNSGKQKTAKPADPDERLLFHGTRKEYVEPICQQGFDWRISGSTTGTKFGRGSYFARDAKYSACYAYDCEELFLVRVLVGSFEVGKPSYVRPPPRDPRDPKVLHDSCVDNKVDPNIFVVFEHQQSYPEYLINFKRK